MRVAVLGPIAKDEVFVDGKKHISMGGIPFYVGKALQSLGVPCTLFVSHAKDDLNWVKEQLRGLELVHFFSEKTLCFRLKYSSENPDQRVHETFYSPNKTGIGVVESLEEFDYIIMGPLFYGDVDESLFEKLKHKKIVLGNFGMFNYAEGNKMVKKHPEKALAIMRYLEYLFLDEQEAKFVAQKKSLEEAVSLLQQHVKKIVITKGSKGSEIFVGSKKFTIPAFPPKKLVDPTGAGDTYLAAFVASLSFFKDDYERAGKFAAMAATVSIEEKGPLKASKEELLHRLG